MLNNGNPLLKEVTERPSQKQQDFAVGKRRYNGTASSPHSGGGIDLGGYRKRDATARATKAMLTSRKNLSDWK